MSRIGQEIVYAIEIPDDPKQSAMVWSFVELQNEVDALKTLISHPRCVIFLFNELAVSMAWTELDVPIDAKLLTALKFIKFHSGPDGSDAKLVGNRLDEIRAGADLTDTQVLSFHNVQWNELKANYITNRASVSGLSLFSTDEGGQQEEIAVWLTDSLHPRGCIKSPQVHEKVVRELSDILLSHEFGAFLIESKALSVLTRENLPNRNKLASDLIKHVRKASRQLSGGIKNLRNNIPVTDSTGKHLHIERHEPAHAIILVPDLSLLQNATEFGPPFIYEFMQTTAGFLHILDPPELLRIVQAAGMIAKDSQSLTEMMAFDWYLLERAKRAIGHPTPHFAVLFRREPQTNE